MTVVLAAVAFACGGGGGKATPTSTQVATAQPTETPPANGGRGSFDSVYFINDQMGWVAGEIGGQGVILATTDGGATWREQYSQGGEVWRLTFVSSQAGWALAANGNESDLLRTTDGGAKWTTISTIDLPPIPLLAQREGVIDFVSPEVGWAVTGDHKLLKTINGGRMWTPAGLSDVRSVCFGDELNGWIWTITSTSSETISKMLRTTDGGVTWNQTDVTGGEIQCSGSQEVWARSHGPFVGGTIIDYVLWHTADGGGHWVPVLGHQSMGPLANSIPTDPGPQPGPWTIGNSGSAYFVGLCAPCNTSTLVVTHDGGATWSAPVQLTALSRAAALSFPDSLHGWAVGLHVDAAPPYNRYPVILATTDGGETWTQQYP